MKTVTLFLVVAALAGLKGIDEEPKAVRSIAEIFSSSIVNDLRELDLLEQSITTRRSLKSKKPPADRQLLQSVTQRLFSPDDSSETSGSLYETIIQSRDSSSR
jgi:hypothetical protein